MSFADALVLRAAAAWTVFIWVTRIGNILGDDRRSTGFKAVHVVLALISIAFAVAIWAVARRNRKGRSHREEAE